MNASATQDRDFALRHRADILAIVDQMQRERTLATVEFADGHAIVSSVLQVRRDTDALVIDIALDSAQNHRLFSSKGLHFVAELDHVQVAFDTGPASTVMLADGPAALVSMPETVVRLQRREWFRAPLPAEPPVQCTVLGEDGVAIPGQAIDISPGGAGLLVTDIPTGESMVGTQRTLILSLPEVGRLELHATVRTVTKIAGATDGLPKLRMGFRFDALPPKTACGIQRYVQRVEVNQLRLLRRGE
jgi:c-di-GMP-binding flagellar brake protein YcgR